MFILFFLRFHYLESLKNNTNESLIEFQGLSKDLQDRHLWYWSLG